MKVKPIESQTRIRTDHNTAGGISTYAQPTDTIEGNEVFIAPVDFTYNGKVIQKVGDQWLKVLYINGVPASGWIAITNMGIQISTEVIENPPDEVHLTHTIEVFSDGSIKIDGLPYL